MDKCIQLTFSEIRAHILIYTTFMECSYKAELLHLSIRNSKVLNMSARIECLDIKHKTSASLLMTSTEMP